MELEDSNGILAWLEKEAPWQLKIADFYEQYEFSFSNIELPPHISSVFDGTTLQKLKVEMEKAFVVELSERIDITAHKLVSDQRIRVHNDYIPGKESHRVLIQFNRGWTEQNGGVLMFFNSDDAADIHSAFLPAHNTSIAFEISPASFHAVSAINFGERYTLVVSFYRK